MTREAVTLKGGGSVALVVEVDFLTVSEDDFRFVRGLVDMMRGYNPPPSTPPSKPPVKATAKTTGKKRGRPPKPKPERPTATAAGDAPPAARRRSNAMPSLEDIARVVLQAIAAGSPTTEALMEHFGAPRSAAKNWAPRARKAGLLPSDGNVSPISSARSVRGKPKGPKSLGGRRPEVDYREVAAVMVEVRDAGGAVQSEIATRFGVPPSTAKNWMARCREQGLIKPLEANLKVVEDNTAKDNRDAQYHGPAVADCYREAIRDSKRAVQAVADRFDIDKAIAGEWVRRARADGWLPPAAEPQLPSEERRELLAQMQGPGA